ncbi:response regulator [Candidatus Fermentibacteria bacterium]|nr:response regulator [Candidatus Fermentibacteria bacterium]
MSSAPGKRVLIVEDDTELAELLSEYLSSHALEVSVLHRGAATAELVRNNPPDLVVLDLMLPDVDGLDVCRELREFWQGPILMLTAMKEDADIVAGLETGADDYVGKPVSPRVLLARIRALLRRRQASPEAEGISIGPLRVSPPSREAYYGQTKLDLTSTEYDLLELLASRAGRVQERRNLVEELRGIDFTSIDRSVDVIVSRIRRKLRQAGGNSNLIRTVRGVGYMMTIPEDR